MKKVFTLLAVLLGLGTSSTFAGGPSAPNRYDNTFGQDGFYIDTTSGTYIQYNEIMVGTAKQFWVGGVTNGSYLAKKFTVDGSPLMTKTGLAYNAAGAYTGVLSGTKFYLGGQSSNGGHYQNMAFNFDGTTNPIFHQTSQPDSFLTEALFGPQYPVGQSDPNCSDVLSNGHIVTAINNYSADSLYIAEFDPVQGTTVMVHPKLTSGSGVLRLKALRTIPGTNSYAVLVYNVQGSSTVFIVTNGVATALYSWNGIKYEAMIPVSATQMLLGGDNMVFFNVTNGNTTATPSSLAGVIKLSRDATSNELYAFTGNNIYAMDATGTFDPTFNPDGFGNNFYVAPVTTDFLLGSSQVYYTDMEMQGNDILISGFVPQLNNTNLSIGYASFIIKLLGKGSVPNACANFSVQLDSVYGTTGCDFNAHITLSGQFPMTAYINWSSGGTTVSVNSSPYIPNGLCPETYEIVFEDGHHCTGIVNFVTPPVVPCVAPVVAGQLAPAYAFCEGDQMQLGPLTVTGAGYTHQWYNNGVALSGGNFGQLFIPTMSSADAGTYYYVATNACGSDTSNSTTVSMIGNTTPAIQQNGDVLTAVGYASGAQLQWYFNNSILDSATDVTYTATLSGDYYVVATNQAFCTRSSAILQVVVTGLDEVKNSPHVAVYPNPANSTLFIECVEGLEMAEVYNLVGERVLAARGNVNSLNITALPQGIYTLRAKTISGKTVQQKFTHQ